MEIPPPDLDPPLRSAGRYDGLLAWAVAPEETMRIGRTIIIPAILALGVTGSVLSSSAATAAAGHAPSSHVLAATSAPAPDVYYRG